MPLRPRRRGKHTRPPKPWRGTLTFELTPAQNFTAWAERLISLADGDALDQLLRRAAVEVLLVEYRQRFAQALPRIVTTRRGGRGRARLGP
jgi:hypothetical protein